MDICSQDRLEIVRRALHSRTARRQGRHFVFAEACLDEQIATVAPKFRPRLADRAGRGRKARRYAGHADGAMLGLAPLPESGATTRGSSGLPSGGSNADPHKRSAMVKDTKVTMSS
jgi:hypothetical protein